MGDLQTHSHVFLPTRPTGCQAFSASTGKQCGVHWIKKDYCGARGHKQQNGKCFAITRTTNKRCSGFITPDGRGYFCERHQDWATPNETMCKGSKVHNGPKCHRRVFDPNYPFCSTKHDERINYCDPSMFRKDGLRGLVLSTLRKRDGDHDYYDPSEKILGNARGFHVDHSFEIQQFSYCWQFDIFRDDEEKNDLTDYVRNKFVNELFNLVMTSAPTNLRKGVAVTNTLEDLMKYSLVEYGRLDVRSLTDIRTASFNDPIVTTFNDRLIEQGLGRNSTRAIRRRMGQSLRSWQYKCQDQGETPIYNVLGGIANEIFTVFDLAVED